MKKLKAPWSEYFGAFTIQYSKQLKGQMLHGIFVFCVFCPIQLFDKALH